MNKTLIAIICISLGLAGCVTTNADLKSNSENRQKWEVTAPIDIVFKKYKDYAEENMSGGDFLWSGGLRVKGFFYGPDAELSIKMEGNPLAQVTYLHFELKKEIEGTLVTTWYYNGPWKSNAEKFKILLPTKVLNDGP